MALKAAYMTPEIYYACTLHALTVETEEIVGLLIGNYIGDKAYIKSIVMMQRLDKRKDRVEISPENLVTGVEKANEISNKCNESVNVIGWYHSHPRITVPPSHVDLRTQALYQTMDDKFVGLIVSGFNENKSLDQDIHVTCFQSSKSQTQLEIPLHIESSRIVFNPCLDAIFELPLMLSVEELISYQNSQNSSDELITKIHNDSAFASSMCHLIQTVVNPLYLHAKNRIMSTNLMLKFLEEEKKELEEKLKSST